MRPRRLHVAAIGAGLVIAAALIPFLVSDWRALKAARYLSATVDDWKDGQRQALALLVIYAQTESLTDFSNFEIAIGRSLALRPVRLQLSAKRPDPNQVAQRCCWQVENRSRSPASSRRSSRCSRWKICR